ncbi:hypothetical protein ACFWTE_17340 [Nocardiopsis sp. NPDC058631]|uniref:hypothetical protein n=1 Tax=Nocardiopsis sp. NPDC058631 TaxID=3346566 RepID=UPI00365FD878
MSLFPVGVWETARALAMSGAGLGVLLLTPVIAGVILLMSWLGTQWLERAGVQHPAASAALVTATSMVTPVVVAYLAPAATPLPAGSAAGTAFATAVVATLGMGAAMLVHRPPGRRQPGVLPAVLVVAVLLALLPSVSDLARAVEADEQSRSQIMSHEQPIAVLDHPGWTPTQVYEVHEGLQLTYRDQDGGVLHVVTWDAAHSEQAGIRSGCELSGTWCRDLDDAVVVHYGDGHPSELRLRLDDGTITSIFPEPGTAGDLVDTSNGLRTEREGERELLAESVTG